VIAGAGPVGLCAALKLARDDVSSLVLEQEPELPTDLRASTFHPPTLDMLQELSLADEVLRQGLKVPDWQVRLHETHERAVFDLTVLQADTAHPYRVQFEQADFCRLLAQSAARSEQIDLRFGARVTGVAQNGGSLRVEWSTGDETRSVSAPYLIAADGANSTLRELLHVTFSGLTYPETTILATTTFPFEDHLPGLSWVNYCWAEHGTFSLLKVPDRWRCSLYPDSGEPEEQALQPDHVQEKLQRIVPNPEGYEILEIRPYRIHQRIIDCYRVGRVLFAGDAAHVNSPSGGMGMNCGIHDAFNLTDKLSKILNHGAGDELLDLYDRQRRPIARDEILKQADANRRRMQERDPAARRKELKRLQKIAADPAAAREFLLRSSMIAGLREAASIT
jgi:3-(3-hydroxy-phenyl)propionate hydroxylase